MNVPRSARASVVSRHQDRVRPRHRRARRRRRTAAPGSPSTASRSTPGSARCPRVHGEKVVIRLLDPRRAACRRSTTSAWTPTSSPPCAPRCSRRRAWCSSPARPGPARRARCTPRCTRSDKPDLNIVTLEDPVEVQMPGITQVQVHERSGLTFSRGPARRPAPGPRRRPRRRGPRPGDRGARAPGLHHRPPRAHHAAHELSAIAALTRLVDMGVEPFLAGVGAHRGRRAAAGPPGLPGLRRGRRAGRRLLGALGVSTRDAAPTASPRRGTGCAECGGTGYRGRTGVFEVLPVDAAHCAGC